MINGMRIYSVVIFLWGFAVWAQNATFEDHPAIAFGNDKLDLLILKQGASVASVVLHDDPAKLNPLWAPARMAREAGGRSAFNPGTGQFLCVDGFGGVSPEERAAGLPTHGEAHLAEWESRQQNGQLVLTTQLPHTQELVTRTMTIAPGENVVIYETTLEISLGSTGRYVGRNMPLLGRRSSRPE